MTQRMSTTSFLHKAFLFIAMYLQHPRIISSVDFAAFNPIQRCVVVLGSRKLANQRPREAAVVTRWSMLLVSGRKETRSRHFNAMDQVDP